MKRPIIAGLLLLCAGAAAKADHMEFNWYDMIRPDGHKRSDAAFQADLNTCNSKAGNMDNLTPAYKSCMRRLGYRFVSGRKVRDPDVSEDGRLICSAKVLRVEDTGWTLNHHRLARLTFRITVHGSKPYETTVSKPVKWHSPPSPGDTLRVYCDPANPSEVHPAE